MSRPGLRAGLLICTSTTWPRSSVRDSSSLSMAESLRPIPLNKSTSSTASNS
uniref:Uncharacterized protein n=1 Tax=Arundo donax TaxID=35708 RepID=A0A0A8ZC35_ARUDO